MKKLRLFLGAIAFVFAFATAFAFKSMPVDANPAFINPSTGVCTPAQVTCSGNDIPCQKDVGGGLGIRTIHDDQPTSCKELKMANN